MISAKHQHHQRPGFSLVEVLLAIFILGIGIISIVSLFPAGIAMQRMSVDDTIGPTVAQNAIAIIRTRVQPEDFGTFEDFDANFVSPTIYGDFGWSRPAFFSVDTTLPNGTEVPAGSISLFNSTLQNTTDGEIPWNQAKYGNGSFEDGPIIIIPQTERYYPMSSTISEDTRAPRPEYVWDCMFRRFQGKIMVAIFVYRTTIVGGGEFAYSASFNTFAPNVPLLPIKIFPSTPWNVYGADLVPSADDALIKVASAYSTTNHAQSWQEPGQWILDQNNNLHRVMSRYLTDPDQMVVELVRPVMALPNIPVYSLDQNAVDPSSENVISNIFYIPREVTINNVPVRLTPVYVTVREL